MKETGMVRRLDDLGRLVIPKEIRKMYKMKEGDSIEIYIDDGKICIRKYDEASPFMEHILVICELLQDKLQNTVLFNNEEYCKQRKIDIEERFIDKSKVHAKTHFENTKVYINQEQRYSGYFIPVVAYGNYYGSFIVLMDHHELKEEEVDNIDLFASYLSNLQH